MADSPELLKVEKSAVETGAGVEAQETQGETKETLETRESGSVEKTPEQKKEQELLQQAEQLAPSVSQPPPVPKDPVVVDIENILADSFGEIYLGLPEDKRPIFKQKGEEVATAIKQLIDSGKVKTKSILDLIRDWLKLVPGINKFFLEQEAKIKTDEVMNYVETNK